MEGSNVAQGHPPSRPEPNQWVVSDTGSLVLYLKEHDLAKRFEISLLSVSRVFITCPSPFVYPLFGLIVSPVLLLRNHRNMSKSGTFVLR